METTGGYLFYLRSFLMVMDNWSIDCFNVAIVRLWSSSNKALILRCGAYFDLCVKQSGVYLKPGGY